MYLLDKANNLNTTEWKRGLFSAAISGFFNALSAALVLPALDTKDFNIFHLKYYIALFAIGATASIISISKFLAAKPLPDYKEVVQMTQTVTGTGDGGKVIETTKETHVEPR